MVDRLTPKELSACQGDPTLAWTIRGPKWIACIEPECGFVGEQLGQHLRAAHALTAHQYKQKLGSDGRSPRYSKNASLLAQDLRQRLSKKRKALKFGKRLKESGRVPTVEKLIASRSGRVMSQQYRVEQGRRMTRARPELWGKHRGRNLAKRGEDWQIARLAVDGATDSQIAAEIGLKDGQSVGARRRKIGFANAKKARVYHHGRPLMMADLLAVSKELGKSLAQVADEMGLKFSTLERRTRGPRRDKPLSTDIGRAFKKRLFKWREEFRHQASSAQGGRPLLLLPSERGKIREEYKALLGELKNLLKQVERKNENGDTTSLPGIRSWVYLQARAGKLRTLALWPDFFGWIAERKDLHPRFTRGALKPFSLAYEFLAWVYGVKVGTIRDAIRPTDG